MAREILPVADGAAVRRHVARLLRRHPRALAAVLGLHAVAAVAGLGAPRLLGNLVQRLHQGATTVTVDQLALAIAGFIVAQSVLTRFAVYVSARLGETVLAELREDFVERVVDIPLSMVERAGSGDLLTRTSRDVANMSSSVRSAVPETLIAMVTALLTVGALIMTSPLFAPPCLIAVPILIVGTRWYLRRAPAGYLRENAAYADITDGLAETVAGARTAEALGVGPSRIIRTDHDISRSFAAERYTLFLRTVWFPLTEVSYILPVVATLLIGGWFTIRGWVTLGQVTAATLYAQQLIDPLDRLLRWLDGLQVGNASLARLLGVAEVPPDRVATGVVAHGEGLRLRDVRYAYADGVSSAPEVSVRDVLHGVDLTVRPGERLAMVGPSGAGKSTLGRLIAGIDGPRTGEVSVGGAPLVEMPLGELRSHVALVTQEHHVFGGTLRDNVALARPDASGEQVRVALAAVDALDWALDLPSGLDTPVGAGGYQLTAAQAQQLALARLVLANPHTLVLDEATSMIDPRAARRLERSLAAVLSGRTVIAIAHRLFSAHDADRVAVVDGGRIVELGSHDELVAAGGSYAALWNSWHGAPPTDH